MRDKNEDRNVEPADTDERQASRRRFLKRFSIGTGVVAVSSAFYLFNQRMVPGEVIPGKVLCDLHAHPDRDFHVDELIERLSAPGLVGLAMKNWYGGAKDILTYEQALDVLPSGLLTEIDPGKLARCGDGYIARTQEVRAGRQHLLVLDWEGDYFPSYNSIEVAVNEIRSRNGIIILNHPFALEGKRVLTLPKTEEEAQLVEKAYCLVDEVEVHNALCINIVPFFYDLREINELAEKLRREKFAHFKGVANSDCHHYPDQLKIVGIYIDQALIEVKGMGGIREALLSKDFIRLGDPSEGPYSSRMSMLEVALTEYKFIM